MRTLLFLSCLIVLGTVASRAESSIPNWLFDLDLLEDAESAFAEGLNLRHDAARARPHFRRAAERYDLLRRGGVSNALLYRNLGNSWLLAGELPRAILSYHQGLRVAPGDRELLAALDRAREQVVYPGGFRPVHENRPPWLPRIPGQWLFLTAVGLSIAGWVCLTRWLMVRGGRWFVVGVLALAGVAGLAMLVFQEQRQQSAQAQPVVVVAEDGVLLRKGNSLNFPPLFDKPLNRGVEARLLFGRGDWLQIQVGDKIGWVPAQFVLIEEPENRLPIR